MLFGQEHVKRYLETDGAEGHEWQGTTRADPHHHGPPARASSAARR